MKVDRYLSVLQNGPLRSDLPEIRHVHLLCDNQQVAKVVTKGLAEGASFLSLKPPHHYTLLEDIERVRTAITTTTAGRVTMHWIPGHTSVEGNVHVDNLAESSALLAATTNAGSEIYRTPYTVHAREAHRRFLLYYRTWRVKRHKHKNRKYLAYTVLWLGKTRNWFVSQNDDASTTREYRWHTHPYTQTRWQNRTVEKAIARLRLLRCPTNDYLKKLRLTNTEICDMCYRPEDPGRGVSDGVIHRFENCPGLARDGGETYDKVRLALESPWHDLADGQWNV